MYRIVPTISYDMKRYKRRI